MPEFIGVIAHDNAEWDPEAMARWYRDRVASQDRLNADATFSPARAPGTASENFSFSSSSCHARGPGPA
jgi:hypothetical protein